MPMADSRCCSLCGYWHSPGSDHISPLRTYGHCARCGNEHSVGPCPKLEEPMRFPSRAERLAMAEHEQRQMRALAQWGRQRLIEQAVRLATDLAERRHYLAHRMRIEACYGREVRHRCIDCTVIENIVRARFRELAG